MRPRLSLWKTIECDYLAWLCFVIPFVLWSFYLFLWLSRLGGEGILNAWPVILALSALGALGLYLRYHAIRLHFVRGVEVPGKIVRTMHLQDLGRVIYRYTYLTKEFQTTNYVHYATRTMRLDQMTEVTVVLDPARPRSALIKDLYFPEVYMGIEETDDEENA